MCCCARERTAGPLIHTHTLTYIICTHDRRYVCLSLSRVCESVCVYVGVCNIYAHYTPHSATAIDPSLALLFISLSLSLSHSLSLSQSPIICVRKSSSCAPEESKRNAARTGLTTITINTVLYTGTRRG